MSLALEQMGERNQAVLRAQEALKILRQLESPYIEGVEKQLRAWGRPP
jgi:hypothetical protein